MDLFSLLWKLRGTSPLWVLAEELLVPHAADCVLQKPSPVSLQLLSYGTGSCGWESEGSSVQYVRRSGWALQNFSDMRRGTWHKRWELHPPSLPLHGTRWRVRVNGGKDHQQPLHLVYLQEGRAVEGTQWFTALLVVMRREAVANLLHLPYL